jgi:polysaccharide biosynthesis transport protein
MVYGRIFLAAKQGMSKHNMKVQVMREIKMENKAENKAEEIKFRDLLEVIWKRKLIIIIMTMLALISSGIISFFLLPTEYVAKAILLTNPINLSTTKTTGNITIDNLSKLPNLTIDYYLQQLKSPVVLENTIKKLDLRTKSGAYISVGSLAGMISASIVTNSSQIMITVTSSDPEQAAGIANTLGQSLSDYLVLAIRDQIQQLVDLISSQMASQQDILIEKIQAVSDFINQNGDVDLLQNEVTNLQTQIGTYQGNLRDTEAAIARDTEVLKVIQQMLQSSNITSDGFMISVDPQHPESSQIMLNLTGDQLEQALMQMEISQTQARLINGIARKQSWTIEIGNMTTHLNEVQIKLTQQEMQYTSLKNELEAAQQNYDAFRQKYNEAVLLSTADIGKTSIMISSAAAVPESPNSPNIIRNLLIAALFGFFLGVFVVIVGSYWKKPETGNKK